MPRVSVVIPAHDPGPWLEPALESVHAQSFDDVDVLVVDDGSREDLSWVPQRFPRTTLLRQAPAGASAARNRGILASSGELVALMDQDDLWARTKLEHQVRALDAVPDAGLCFCGLRPFHSPEQPSLDGGDDAAAPVIALSGAGGAPGLEASLRFFGRAFVVPSTVMIRREALASTGLLDPWMPFTGDFDLLIRLGSVRPVVQVVSLDVWYRVHGANFSRDYATGRAELRQLRSRYRHQAMISRNWGLLREVERSLRRPRRLYAHQAFDRARQSWRAGELGGTVAHLWRSATFDPRVLVEAVGQHRGGRAAIGPDEPR